MNDMTAMLIRYALIAFGTWGATKGWFREDEWGPLVEKLQGPIGGLIAAGGAIWGVWIKRGTGTVPIETAARKDVPTVNPFTGSTIAGKDFVEKM